MCCAELLVILSVCCLPHWHYLSKLCIIIINISNIIYVIIDDYFINMSFVYAYFQGHAWEATLSIYTPDMSPDGAVLSGTLAKTFDVADGVATFDDLSLDVRGRYALHASVTSTPSDHSLTGYSTVIEVASSEFTLSEKSLAGKPFCSLLFDKFHIGFAKIPSTIQ